MHVLVLAVFLLPAFVHAQQPAPPPVILPPHAGVLYGPQGERTETFQTPTGSVTYGQHGHRWQTFDTPTGSVIYDHTGRSWRVFPNPATSQPAR